MMTSDQVSYLVFGIVLLLALIFDLGLLSKKGQKVTIKQALYQTFFWVGLAIAFFIFMWLKNGQTIALEYLSAYLMEWSLSIDNIFVFILIFSAFSVKEKNYGRVLLIGILMAIVFRIIFITVGVALVDRFSWILYLFGIFLIYTGYKMFTTDEEEEFDPQQSRVYKFIKRFLPLVPHDGEGRFAIRKDGKKFYTTLFVVVIMLATIDIVFALDSIPAVFSIIPDPNKKLLIYSSNIFAVLGLRSLFFLLRGAASKFDFLQQGIAIVLVFIGVKMLLPLLEYAGVDSHYLHMPVWVSLLVIVFCIAGSIFYSIYHKRKGVPTDIME